MKPYSWTQLKEKLEDGHPTTVVFCAGLRSLHVLLIYETNAYKFPARFTFYYTQKYHSLFLVELEGNDPTDDINDT